MIEAICIASGPSLTTEDVALAKDWRDQNPAGRKVFVANTSFRIAPWADTMFAANDGWWRAYGREAASTFSGEKLTHPHSSTRIAHPEEEGWSMYGSSGAAIIGIALRRGAQRVILLGYDCQHTHGQTHWHGEHPPGLPSCPSPEAWIPGFVRLAADFPDATILNSSRATALTVFPIVPLETALGQV